METIANTQQAQAWNGPEGAYWAGRHDRFDALNSGFDDALFSAAAIDERDHVLDIGCGTGQTTRRAARQAKSGKAVGIDISAPMLERARAVTAQEGVPNAVFEEGDAQVHLFPSAGYDVVISRGGVMFFADHVAAFTNIGRALRSGGRMALICPHMPDPEGESAQVFAPVNALVREPSPAARGMMSLSDPARVLDVLTAAGFADVTTTRVEGTVHWGRDAGDAADFFFAMSPVRCNLEGVPDQVLAQAREQVTGALRQYESADGVRLRGAVWLVTATRP
ncbi:type 11 methyltransferase [Streptomyces agglomeratus]|uniref:class I SAM-dependent methyltransferase n=1 Tax=Streptomyces agglomeratus TaxID=285458 RepID=UPI0008527039|nr:class I SAM-dependent methyltransferase [Streptomyces agglomeratus]OEJ37423.1 type 11 methyltransferase [Streptomyces agglomeratus]OEJ48192.1 type 11 methyltransferase [Streptomyces agglomeratus]OEJ49964.1 type 11 methyltransferase [Streptomyces agglomeratus]